MAKPASQTTFTNPPSPREAERTRGSARKRLLIGTIWLIPALLSGGQLYFRMQSMGIPTPFGQAFLSQLLTWYLWAAFLPVLFWLARRFRLDGKRFWSSLLAHFLFSVAIVPSYELLRVLLSMALQPTSFSLSQLPGLYQQAFNGSLFVNYLIYWILIAVTYGIDYYKRWQQKELHASRLEAQLAQAQMHALRMQLHPHFLFNTLNAIAVLVRRKENQTATNMLTGLGDLLRYALENTGKQFVTLKEELDFINRYLQIERIRFKDRLRIEMDVEPDCLAGLVPNLILQPLVENAIRHGIAKRASGGLVRIKAERKNDRLGIGIHDNGPGLPKIQPSTENSGVGLTNTRARLEQLYGSSSRLEFDDVREGGCLVTLTIPYRLIAKATVEESYA